MQLLIMFAGGFKGEQPASFATCAGCHGDDGKGMEFVAPNIRAYDDALVTGCLKMVKRCYWINAKF